jgi:hypothetical protein
VSAQAQAAIAALGEGALSAQATATAALLYDLLPAPLVVAALPGGGVVLHGGDPVLCVARITGAGLLLGPARLRFWGRRAVLVEASTARLTWSQLSADATALTALLAPLVQAAVAQRRAELLPCGRCGCPRAAEEVAIIAATSGPCPCCAHA